MLSRERAGHKAGVRGEREISQCGVKVVRNARRGGCGMANGDEAGDYLTPAESTGA
jgi:hypothetical protein